MVLCWINDFRVTGAIDKISMWECNQTFQLSCLDESLWKLKGVFALVCEYLCILIPCTNIFLILGPKASDKCKSLQFLKPMVLTSIEVWAKCAA